MSDANTKLWKPYSPSDSMPWDLQRVVHLHRRAGFAAPWNVLQRDLSDGAEKSVTRLLEGTSSPAAPEFESLAKSIGAAAVASKNSVRLQAWWLFRMIKSPDPLGERLTLMWHNHFATSNRKVKNLQWMFEQNQRLRKYARDSFGNLLSHVVKHPAMLVWLDADTSKKGKANENLARELLELFTIGIGNFDESDVKEGARALTGLAVVNEKFEYRSSRHDDAVLNLLGKSQPFDGDQLLETLIEHPATAERIAWRICKTFMGEEFVGKEENATAMKELAEGLRQNDLNSLWAVKTVIQSELFFSEDNLNSKVLGPTEFVVGAIRALEFVDSPPSTIVLTRWLTRMGQELFYPPNVGGWNEGRHWLTSRTIVARSNFANSLSQGKLWLPPRTLDLESLCKKHGAKDDIKSKTQWLADLLWGHAPQDIVDEVLSSAKSGRQDSKQLPAVLALFFSRPEHHLS